MKAFLKKKPIVFVLLLGVVISIAVTVFSILAGRHYYYRIHTNGNQISDISVRQYTEDDTPISIVKMSSIEQDDYYTLVYLDSVKPGSGLLELSYTLTNSEGEVNNVTRIIGMKVSKAGVIYIGDGSFNHNGGMAVYYGISIYTIILIIYFIRRRRYLSKTSRYSYAYLSTWAGQIFFTMLFVVYALISLASLVRLRYVDASLISTATQYLMMFMTLCTFPIVFLFAVSMGISNISLIRHEGKRLNNMLGILSGIGLLLMISAVMILFMMFIYQGKDNKILAITYSIVNAFYIVFFSILGGAIISGLQAGYHKPSMDIDYIIILGCAIRKDGTLYPLIRGRVDRAIRFWHEQADATGKKAVFVPSGGQGSDEIISEGEAMKRYLIEQGIEEQYIMAETKSTNTFENMKFSKALIDTVNPSAKIAYSTTNYHVMRSGILAGQANLHIEGMGAPTKWYFWPNALLREVVGMMAYQPKIQLVVMMLLALLAGVAGYVYFLIV